jgi:medium-chain acyl-[acyl-carrier-protein] hydrolase
VLELTPSSYKNLAEGEIMTVPSIWLEKTEVKPYETDFQGRWKPACFFQAMQQAATAHATRLGLGYETMVNGSMLWLLARLKIRFIRIPQLGETLTIRTWPKGVHQKIFFARDFQFLDQHEELIASATSAWLLVDTNQKHIHKPDHSLPADLPISPHLHALDESLEKIPLPDSLQSCFTITPRYNATDLLGHVNNARYVEWASDCFPLEHYSTKHLDWIQINYAHEVKPGEQVELAMVKPNNSNEWIIVGSNISSDTRAFEAAFGWSDLPA